jgi:hypothetical protein
MTIAIFVFMVWLGDTAIVMPTPQFATKAECERAIAPSAADYIKCVQR